MSVAHSLDELCVAFHELESRVMAGQVPANTGAIAEALQGVVELVQAQNGRLDALERQVSALVKFNAALSRSAANLSTGDT